jgi:hypothetical protein
MTAVSFVTSIGGVACLASPLTKENMMAYVLTPDDLDWTELDKPG